MIEIAFSKSFKRAFKRSVQGNRRLEERFWQKTEIFTGYPYHQSLRTHKLSGKLKDLWSFSVDNNCRIIFYFETTSKVVFIDIGTHDEVY